MSIRQKLQYKFNKKLKTTGQKIKKSILESKIWKRMVKTLNTIRKNKILIFVCAAIPIFGFNIYWVANSYINIKGTSPHFYCNERNKVLYPIEFDKYCGDGYEIRDSVFLGEAQPPSGNVWIGHAIDCEPGANYISGASPGDQTGQEVAVTDWYYGKWIAVFRPKDQNKAKLLATYMTQACENDNIGYCWDLSPSINTAYSRAGSIPAINLPCNTQCSNLVAFCCELALLGNLYSDTKYMLDTYSSSGNFEVLQDSMFLLSDEYLKEGDILLCNGHTAIVVYVKGEKEDVEKN